MHPSAQKVAGAAQKMGLAIEIREFAETTRTAQEAADAIGCELAQIVKSLCFTVNEQPIMALVSGVNQLDVQRASADAVKAATGFSIGGVPPFGHLTPMTIFVDEDLLQFGTVWAAAGTPFAVFAVGPDDLVRGCGGTAVNLKRD
jgi:prolyl-tRNA editing enzyme YbaK/EbsC (Cys-tRNA(Pro) deacylase)